MKEYYLYSYLDPRKPGRYIYPELDTSFLYEPIYIGKGSGNRLYDHIKLIDKRNPIKLNKIKKIKSEGLEPIVYILKKSNSEKEIFKYENLFITSIGRYDIKTGPLCNVTNGGEGSSGYKFSSEQRLRQSILRKGKPSPKKGIKTGKSSWIKGKSHNPETLEKLKPTFFKRGQTPWNAGMKMSKEHCKKLSKSHIGFKLSKETLEKLSNIRKGKSKSEDHKRKIRDSLCKKVYKFVSPYGQEILTRNYNQFCK
jgi:hypothetical protein